ncbi:hypothetical protein [Rheinheimera sp.]|uniref:hypothetical protein n=1 Tax=Rheinheimera sp. TaxID=1869214 RepID=UPI003D2DB1A5
MSSSKASWHLNKKPEKTEFELSKEERRQLALRFRSPIKVGLAIIPFCEVEGAWLLPDGPSQKNRYVRHYDIAFAFAVRMNDILQHYPLLAVRLEPKEAA